MTGVRSQPFDGADVDDASSAAFSQNGDRFLGQKKGSLEIDRHHPIPILLRHFLDRLLEHYPCVVDENVDAPNRATVISIAPAIASDSERSASMNTVLSLSMP